MTVEIPGGLATIGVSSAAVFLAMALAFDTYCLIDIARHNVRHLPKWAWALIVLAFPPLGGIVYLAIGKDSTDS